jgi:catechol 2,3-dioxygenase-like lactoylglutathione lyase family enzyme
MAAELDHLIVPSRSRIESARLLGHLLGVPWAAQAAFGPFSPVYVSPSLTMDFDEWSEPVPRQHCAFRVTDEEFDSILQRIKAAGLPFRSSPTGPDDHQVNYSFGGRLVYWSEPDGHAWEILTVSYARPTPPTSASGD